MYYSFRPNAALKWDLVNSNLELGLDDNVDVESKSFSEGDGEAAILKSEKQLTTYDVAGNSIMSGSHSPGLTR